LGLRLLAACGKKSGAGNGHNRQSQTCHAGNGSGRGRQITVHGRTVVRFARSPQAVLRFNMSLNIRIVKDRWLYAVSKRLLLRHFAPGAATRRPE
jgi:hypothetical protein